MVRGETNQWQDKDYSHHPGGSEQGQKGTKDWSSNKSFGFPSKGKNEFCVLFCVHKL